MFTNEEGTSILELTIYVALVTALAGISTPAVLEAKTKIETQLDELESLQNSVNMPAYP